MSSKRRKRVRPLGENDRISALPDHILTHILSLLPTKLAARSRVLSTTWKRVFNSSSNLDFDDSLTEVTTDLTKENFLIFVSSVLYRRKLAPMDKFRLHCTQYPYDIETIIAWINFAICSKIRELDVKALVTESAPLEPLLFNLQTLVTLKLCGKFVIDVPKFAFLPQLKEMHLEEVEFRDNESARDLFAHCPVLEELTIYSCEMRNISVLAIWVPSLKKFMFMGDEGFYGISLGAPKLEEMCYSADAHIVWLNSGNSFESLTKAVIFPNHMFDTFALATSICDVRSLALSGHSMRALFGSDQPLPIFRNLTCLELLPNYNIGWIFLPYLLASSPCLEVLSFNHGLHDHYGIILKVTRYLPIPVPTCVSGRLKKVIFGSFRGEEKEFEMLEYLLKNAKVLEEIAISPTVSRSGLEDRRIPSMKNQFLMIKRLLKLQRCSRACRIVFTEESIEDPLK